MSADHRITVDRLRSQTGPALDHLRSRQGWRHRAGRSQQIVQLTIGGQGIFKAISLVLPTATSPLSCGTM